MESMYQTAKRWYNMKYDFNIVNQMKVKFELSFNSSL